MSIVPKLESSPRGKERWTGRQSAAGLDFLLSSEVLCYKKPCFTQSAVLSESKLKWSKSRKAIQRVSQCKARIKRNRQQNQKPGHQTGEKQRHSGFRTNHWQHFTKFTLKLGDLWRCGLSRWIGVGFRELSCLQWRVLHQTNLNDFVSTMGEMSKWIKTLILIASHVSIFLSAVLCRTDLIWFAYEWPRGDLHSQPMQINC